MKDEKLAAITATWHKFRRVELYRGDSEGERKLTDELLNHIPVLLAEVEQLRDVLRQIINRYRNAEGTPLAHHSGLPWAMADDARSALGLPIDAIHKDTQP